MEKGYTFMGFAENLKAIRKQRGVTQEQLAELLAVSRQAVSKWESGNGYPETEKLLIISKELNISLDYLMYDSANLPEKNTPKTPTAIYPPNGKIAIASFDSKSIVICQSVKVSDIFMPGKDEPRYILNGIDKVTFWGEHSTLLGWYATLDDIQKEVCEISEAISRGEGSYTLRYAADIEYVGIWGQPKLIKTKENQ